MGERGNRGNRDTGGTRVPFDPAFDPGGTGGARGGQGDPIDPYAPPTPIVDYNGNVWTYPTKPAVYAAADNTYGRAPITAVNQAVWDSGLLDLRPDLQNRVGYEADANPVSAGYQRGSADTLHFHMTNLGTILLLPAIAANYRFFSIERAATVNPTEATFVNEPVDITLAVLQGNQTAGSVLLRWRPEGPVRYWGVAIVVYTFDATATQNIMVAGAAH